ncbi:MAG TPA: hypothetical protein VJ246_02965, partial [Patescibacteria group bacterium]|nr:hypothetical protein [Patescibacteria group bacterium]
GDVLIVAIESDVRVRELKGEGRPIHRQSKRLDAVRSLDCVDVAFVLPDDFKTKDAFRELLHQFQPHIYACSSHSSHLEVKRALMKEIGGEVCIVREHNPNISTTKIVERSVQ